MKRFYLLIISLLVLLELPANSIRGGLPFFYNYHPSEYHGHSQNWAAATNSKGFLFVANGDGILHYDGHEWKKYLLTNSATPFSILCDKNDVLWIGAQAEIGMLVSDKVGGYKYLSLTNLIPTKYLDFGYAFSIFDYQNSIYFLTQKYIFRLNYSGFHIIPIEPHSVMFKKKDFLFLFQPQKGFFVISGNKKMNVLCDSAQNLSIINVMNIAEDEAFMLDINRGLIKTDFNFSNKYAIKIDVSQIDKGINETIKSINAGTSLRLSNGNFAFATQRKGTIITDSTFNILYHLSRESGVGNESHNYLIEDKQHNLWIMMDNGICKVNSQSPLRNFNDIQGLKGSVLDIKRCFNRIFVGTWQGVFCEGNSNNNDDNKVFYPIDKILSQAWNLEKIRLDNKNYLLVSAKDGLYLIDSLIQVNKISNDPYFFAKPIVIDNKTYAYAGNPNLIKLIDFSKNPFKPRFINLSSINNRIISNVVSKNNEIVLGTLLDGVYVVSPKSDNWTNVDSSSFYIQHIGILQGLPFSDQNHVFSLNEYILIGTQSGVYSLIREDGFYAKSKYVYNYSLLAEKTQIISALKEDVLGNIWIQFSSKLTGRKNLFYINSKNLSILSNPFRGFPDIEYYSIYPEKDSLVWFGSDDGLFCFNWNISNSFKYNDAFYTTLSNIYSNDVLNNERYIRTKDIDKNLYILQKGNIRFDFAAGYYIHERQVKFSYKLDGYDDDWSIYSTENYKGYTNLPHGNYTFRVRAMNPFGVVGKHDSFSFKVQTPWFFKWWAIIFAVLLLVALVFAISKIATLRLLKAKMRLESIIQNRTIEVQSQKKSIELEKEKADRLLLNILPVRIAEELKEKGHCEPEYYESTTVLFTDICGFTHIAEIYRPNILVAKLDTLFTSFDEICARNKLEKIKTIGDSHMSAGGIPVRNKTHAIDATLAAIEMQIYLRKFTIKDPSNSIWKLRIGINTGELTAGIVGKKKFAFDIWGDTVNTASRLQDAGEPNKINISSKTAKIVSPFFQLKYRGKKTIKHKGEVDMFFVEGILPELSIDGRMERPNKIFWDKYNKLLEIKVLDF